MFYNLDMELRKEPLVNGCYYHVFSRSIAKYEIFNDAEEYFRMLDILRLYRFTDFKYRYAKFKELEVQTQNAIIYDLENNSSVMVEIVAYCLMPTHIHLLLKQIINHGISKYLGKILNSYSRFFNERHKRTGPLWTGRFKSVLVKTDEQLLHLMRYLHLNPTSAGLVDNPQEWSFSSYRESIDPNNKEGFCSFGDLFDLSPAQYEKFVLNQKAYQRELALIKNLLIDDYTG